MDMFISISVIFVISFFIYKYLEKNEDSEILMSSQDRYNGGHYVK